MRAAQLAVGVLVGLACVVLNCVGSIVLASAAGGGRLGCSLLIAVFLNLSVAGGCQLASRLRSRNMSTADSRQSGAAWFSTGLLIGLFVATSGSLVYAAIAMAVSFGVKSHTFGDRRDRAEERGQLYSLATPPITVIRFRRAQVGVHGVT